MKIAISATGTDLSAGVDQRFGRAAFFLIYDLETDVSKFVKNTQALNSPSGAGIQAAQNVLNNAAEAILTGHCGPKAFQAFQGAGIPVYVGVSGSLQDAISDFKAGKLQTAATPDVEGHW